jgi:hypothetical protein
MSASPQLRKRIEAQGFCNLDDATLGEIGQWLRWSPVLCSLVIATGVALASPTILWTLAVIAFAGTVLPFHPFDLLYNHGMRHLSGTRPLPRQGPPRRFACGLATAWLVATGWAFHAGNMAIGYALGAVLFLVAATIASTNICIPSMLYNALFRPRRWP